MQTADDDDHMVDPLTLVDIEISVGKLKSNKTPGQDNLPAEPLKNGGETLNASLYSLLQSVCLKEIMPEEWNTGIICPIYKKENKLDCNNYRGITLLSTVYKILMSIINERLKQLAGKRLGEYQCSFRLERDTTDQLLKLFEAMQDMGYGNSFETY